jgi:hypothetical protein
MSSGGQAATKPEGSKQMADNGNGSSGKDLWLDVKESIDQLQSDVDGWVDDIADLTDIVTRLDRRSRHMQRSVKRFGERLGRLAERMKATETRLDALEGKQ